MAINSPLVSGKEVLKDNWGVIEFWNQQIADFKELMNAAIETRDRLLHEMLPHFKKLPGDNIYVLHYVERVDTVCTGRDYNELESSDTIWSNDLQVLVDHLTSSDRRPLDSWIVYNGATNTMYVYPEYYEHNDYISHHLCVKPKVVVCTSVGDIK